MRLLARVLRRVRRAFGRETRFLTVMMDFTNRCNLKCIMCHFSLPDRSQVRQEISIEEFERLAPQLLPHVDCLALSCATEPFMSRDFFKALPIVRAHGVPFVYYVTNGTMLTEEAARETIRWKVDMVMLSLDSANRETYESIRRNANFDTVIANIRRLRDLKRELRSSLPKLRFNVTLMRSNIEEVEDLLRLIKELGGEQVDFRHVVPFEGLDSSELSLFEHKQLTNRQLDKARALARKLGLKCMEFPSNFDLTDPSPAPDPDPAVESEPDRVVDAVPAPATEPTPNPATEPEVLQAVEAVPGLGVKPIPSAPPRAWSGCRMPWKMMVIHPHGGVVPCTNWFTHELMGDVKEQAFPEIWNGPAYQMLRHQIITGDLGPNCRACPSMSMGSVDKKAAFEARKV